MKRLLLCLLPAARLFAADPAVLTTEFIYDSGPYPQIHATTIAETAAGLVAAWFGGTHEKNPDVGIWVSRQVKGKWTESVEVANGIQHTLSDGTVVRHPTWNPVLFQPKNGPLLLFYKAGPTPQTWWGMLTTSTDHGKTWEQPRRLPEGILGPVKNKPVELPDGSLLCPTSEELPAAQKGDKETWTAHFERTRDFGRTWQAALVLENEPGEYSYPAIVQTKDGLVHLTYTWKRQKVKHVVVDPAKLTLKPIADGQWPQ